MLNRRRPRRGKSTRGRMGSWWTIWRVPVLLAIVSAGWWFVYRPYAEEQGWTRQTSRFVMCGTPWRGANGCVVDGDTIVMGAGSRPGQGTRRIRLTGFDAPEIDGACPAESAQAQRARAALLDWLANGPFEWSGEDTPPRDQYGRELRELRRIADDGSPEYLAQVMIGRGLAGESGWGTYPVDWCK